MNNDQAIQRLVELLFPNWVVEDALLLRWNRGGGVQIEFRPDHASDHVVMVLDTMAGRGYRTFHYEPAPQGGMTAHFGNPALAVTHPTSWKHAMVRAAIAQLDPPPPALPLAAPAAGS